MTSQMTKDFKMKSRLRALADGGPVDPSVLGTGAAARAGGLLAGRGRQIDAAVDAAAAGAPLPMPRDPAPQPVQTAEAPKKSGLRSLLGLADGGSPARRPFEPVVGTRSPLPSGGGGGLSREAVAAAQNPPAPPPPAPSGIGALPADPLRNPRAIQAAREKAAGLADGGTYLDDGYNANRYQQSQLRDGGRVNGPGGRTEDKVGPVMLSDEEYVLPGDTADAIGRDKLDKIRLATHDFKDERKESALRGRADGGDYADDLLPMDHLADGGNPWIVDSEGVARKANAFGDAAAGPGYQQPRALPPPQGSTAVGPARTPPMGQRPPIDMGMADVVETTAKGGGAGSRAMSALRGAARVGAPVAGIAGAAQSFDDQSTGYRDHFQNSVGAETPLGSVAADAARVLSNVGDAATFGLAGRIGRGLSGIGNEGFVNGFLSPSDRDQYLQNRTQQTMATANAPAAAATAAAPATSALRSDQGPALPVTPGSYQSRRLSEMGVSADVQNSKPIVGANLRTAGTDQYQNLGTYGGNGNIYGKADDPSRPGRINNFVGVGSGASPANEASGSGFNGGTPGATGAAGALQSALRGLGNGSSTPGGPASNGGGGVSVIGGGEDRYDKLAKELRGMYSAKGQGNLAKKLVELEQLRANEQGNIRSNDTSRANAQLGADTSRSNAELSARTNMLEALSRMEQNRASLSATAQAAQLKYLQDAQKTAREGEEKGFDRYTGAIGSMFTTTGPDGKQTVDKAAQERFRSFIEGSDPKAGEKFASMGPQQQQVLLQNFKTMYDMNEARNKTAQTGSIPSNTGGVTNRMDMPTDVREATWNDYWNNNLPLKDYVWSNLPFTNKNVVQTESGQPVLYSDYTTTDGKRDLDKEKIVRDSVSARRSALRSN